MKDHSEAPSPQRATQLERHEVDDVFSDAPRSVKHDARFWAIIIGLGVMLLLSALENSVLVTAAPIVLKDIPLGDNWIWLTNAFFLCSAAFQPFIGQLCNAFGRRWVVLPIVAIFVLGSGICGGATSGSMLIAGRAVQGIGSGGIIMAFDIIISDLVPLRFRGNYVAIILLIYSIGSTLGPFIGGAIAESGNWRWIFYLNLPVGGVSFVILALFLRVNHVRDASWRARLARLDILGNGILILGSTSILIALSYAGSRYPWSAWKTLVPLVLGFVAFAVFAIFEQSPWAPQAPVMPPRLFAGRTSAVIAVNTFINTALVYWSIFFLPLYFQSVQLTSARRAGVCLVPLSLFGIPAAAVGALILTRIGRYKMLHLIAWVVFTIGRGLYLLLDERTPTAHWVVFQLFAGIGAGLLLNTLLPAFQAPLSEADQATATATWNFLKTMGGVWGVAIPSAVFSDHVNRLLNHGAVSDPIAAEMLANGGAYQYGSADFVRQFSAPVQEEIRYVYREAIRRVWIISFAFMGIALLLVLLEKDIPLRKVLETEYGMENRVRNVRDKGEASRTVK